MINGPKWRLTEVTNARWCEAARTTSTAHPGHPSPFGRRCPEGADEDTGEAECTAPCGSFARTLTSTPAPRPGPRLRRGRSKARAPAARQPCLLAPGERCFAYVP
ncbi:hypothetical protein XacyCFBP1159_01610 [Xanthomonas arboricola pv. corylina]|nr:hypothetical protein XacyCFBP2565_11580 [Xanthomonas arboricola pv. corylina]PPU63396.1 hypothetical protein XacyCFBP1159_01610 [Xanthomonas arboricola pv. corylina]